MFEFLLNSNNVSNIFFYLLAATKFQDAYHVSIIIIIIHVLQGTLKQK